LSLSVGSLRVNAGGSLGRRVTTVGTFTAYAGTNATFWQLVDSRGSVVTKQAHGTLFLLRWGSFNVLHGNTLRTGGDVVGNRVVSLGLGSFTSRITAGSLALRNIASVLALRVGSGRVTGLLTAGSLSVGSFGFRRGDVGTFTVRNFASALSLRVGSARINGLGSVGVAALGSGRSGGHRVLRLYAGTTIVSNVASALALKTGSLRTTGLGSLAVGALGSARVNQGLVAGRLYAGTSAFRNVASALALKAGSLRTTGVGSLATGALGSARSGGHRVLRLYAGTTQFSNVASALAVKAGSLRTTGVGSLATGALGSARVNQGLVAGRLYAGTTTLRNIASALMLRVGSARVSGLGSILTGALGSVRVAAGLNALRAYIGSARIGSLGGRNAFFGCAHIGTLGRVTSLHVGSLMDLGGYGGGSFVGSRAMRRSQLGSEHIRARGIGTEKLADLRVGSTAAIGTIGAITPKWRLIGGGDGTVNSRALRALDLSPDSRNLWALFGSSGVSSNALYQYGTTSGAVVGSLVGSYLAQFGNCLAFDAKGFLWVAGHITSNGAGSIRVAKVGTADMRVLLKGTLAGGFASGLMAIGVDQVGSLWGMGANGSAIQRYGTVTFNKARRFSLPLGAWYAGVRFTKEGLMWLYGNDNRVWQIGTGDGRRVGSVIVLLSTIRLSGITSPPFDSAHIWGGHGPGGGARGSAATIKAFGRYITFSPAFKSGQSPLVNITPVGNNTVQAIAALPVAGSFRLSERFPSQSALGLGVRWNAWAKLQ
jgi:hypothetical protein